MVAAAKHRGEHRVRALHQGFAGGAVVVPTDEYGETEAQLGSQIGHSRGRLWITSKTQIGIIKLWLPGEYSGLLPNVKADGSERVHFHFQELY